MMIMQYTSQSLSTYKEEEKRKLSINLCSRVKNEKCIILDEDVQGFLTTVEKFLTTVHIQQSVIMFPYSPSNKIHILWCLAASGALFRIETGFC